MSIKDDTSDVSAFEAKTHLSELLRETEQGRSFVIRRRGKTVARLIPPRKEEQEVDFSKVRLLFREFRKNISGTLKIKELIEEGRRF